MTQRKISYWLMFFIKVLPLIFLIVVALYSFRHDIYTNSMSYSYVTGTTGNVEDVVTLTASNVSESIFYNTFSTFNKTFNFRNIFNFNEFYLWWCNGVFNHSVPVVFETIFNVLMYEAFIEIITLLYSFIIFIVKFAKRWVGGFYEKTNL